MVITMHPQVIGRPHNITMLEELINYILENQGWITSLRNIYDKVEF